MHILQARLDCNAYQEQKPCLKPVLIPLYARYPFVECRPRNQSRKRKCTSVHLRTAISRTVLGYKEYVQNFVLRTVV